MGVLTKAFTILPFAGLFIGCAATYVDDADIVETAYYEENAEAIEVEEVDRVEGLFDNQIADASGKVDEITAELTTIGDDAIDSAELENESESFEQASTEEGADDAVGADTSENIVPDTVVESVRLNKDADKPGTVEIVLSADTPFILRRSTPTEYVVNIPGASAIDEASATQVAPPGFSGIRSTRVSQEESTVAVRMFVDVGVELKASAIGRNIIVSTVQVNKNARAQLAKPEDGEESEEVDAEVEESPEDLTRQNPTGLRSSDGSKIYTGRLISLDLQDTDIDNALRIIAEVSSLNIIASEGVQGKVTLRLIDVPWDQALDVILKTNGLDQVTEGNVIRIAPVETLRTEREALLEAKRAAENLEDLQVSYLRVSYARVTELQDQVENVLSERGQLAVDERTNQLIVKDIEKGQRAAYELIKKLDLRTPQILLETQIVEAQKNLLRDLGFQWNYSFAAGPATGNPTGYNFPNSVDVTGALDNGFASSFPAGNVSGSEGFAISAVLDSVDGTKMLEARLSAYEQEGDVKIISRPQIATVNNKPAEIKSVEKLRVRLPSSGTSVATGSGASSSGGGQSAFEEIDVGIELRVTPQASADFYVLMDVEAKSSTLGANSVDEIPSTIEREATSTVLVKSGQTFALGGVYRISDRDSVTGIPFLKDIPFLGYFFRSTGLSRTDEELIFFITPHIVEGSFDAGAFS